MVWFRASLVYINNCPKRCNTKQSIYYSANSLYMFRVSTTPIIRSTQNCNYRHWYCAATSLQRGQASPRWREVASQKIMTNSVTVCLQKSINTNQYTPLIRSTQNSNYSLRYCAATSLQSGQAWPRWREVDAQKIMISTGGSIYSFVYSWWWVSLTPETCRVNLQNNK